MVTTVNIAEAKSLRFQSIDQIRGAVMILMALDHTRYFFTNLTFAPENLAQTNIWLFLTRWVTHFCAPGFFLLAGLGIFLFASKKQDQKKVTRYLLTRGAMLVLMELSIVGYAWIFRPGYSFGGVIWAIGWSFILMAGLVYLPGLALLILSAGVLLFHNLLDHVTVENSGWGQFFWRILYQAGSTDIPGITDNYYVLFSLIPWMAIMVFGYALGHYYLKPDMERKRLFVGMGLAMLFLFAILRLTNLYGNPDTLFISDTTSGLFYIQPDFSKTLINFLDTEKYPPSLLYTLMTLGPIFLWLGYSKVDEEGVRLNLFNKILILFGRVPLFFYLLHLYLIHLLALALGLIMSQPVAWLLAGPTASGVRTEGFGFDLWVIHIMWLVVVGLLYPLCKWYMIYKKTHSYGWLKYL